MNSHAAIAPQPPNHDRFCNSVFSPYYTLNMVVRMKSAMAYWTYFGTYFNHEVHYTTAKKYLLYRRGFPLRFPLQE